MHLPINLCCPFQPTLPARGATKGKHPNSLANLFQPTLPARGATRQRRCGEHRTGDFNPRSPHGERREAVQTGEERQYFNPRSPHGERRDSACYPVLFVKNFNPRSPHGERRQNRYVLTRHDRHFNPRSPHGERRNAWLSGNARIIFQPTLPARGATKRSKKE